MRGKDIHAFVGETRLVGNIWTAEAEARGTSIESSAWEVTGSLSVIPEALTGSVATALVSITGCGSIRNTVTLANGEVLLLVREVKA